MEFDCDVLIAGGGPTGVTLAVLLAKRGLKVIVAEKEADIYPLPRAAHVDHEVMRILQETGVAEEVMATSRQVSRYDFLNAKGKLLLRFEGAEQIGPGGWPVANMIHQPSVEAALRRTLGGYSIAKLHSRWELTSYSEDGEGVNAQIATPDGEKTIRARYLVGADGARSPVREAARIVFDDLNFEEPWLVIDVFIDDESRLPKENLQICNPERPTTCVLMAKGRHRWEFMILPGETAEQVSDDAFIEKLLEPWNVNGAVRLERKAVYTFRARTAQQWRKGRVLLAGDAAHQMPPFAGQGMCSGLRDAANLAWKLEAVVRGEAPDALLDSYQPEREPNLRAIIDMAIMMGRVVCTTSKWEAFKRDMKFRLARALGRLPDGPAEYPPISTGLILPECLQAGSYFPQPVAADGTRLDEVLGNGHWLISCSELASPKLAPYANQLKRWFDKHDVEAVLVRPDRFVFGTGTAQELQTAWRTSLAIPAPEMVADVAIVGGGYAGFNLARLLDPHVAVTLVEAREAFVHNVAAIRAVVEPRLLDEIVIPYDRLLKRGKVVQGRVTTVDATGVTLSDGRRVAARAIVVATGSRYAAPFKPGNDSIADFVARSNEAAAKIAAAQSIVIIGGGAVGVELAGEIRAVHPDKSVALVSDQSRLFPMYPRKLHAKLVERLTRLGVRLHLGNGATRLEQTDAPYEGEIALADGTRLSGLIIPAIGTRIADSPAHDLPGIDRKSNGQLGVDKWLRPTSIRNVFAIGDLAATGEGMTVVSTTRQTPWLAKTLRKLVEGAKIEDLPGYAPWKVPPILLPLGPSRGASVLPFGRGAVVGDGMTSSIKGKALFIPRYHKEFGRSRVVE